MRAMSTPIARVILNGTDVTAKWWSVLASVSITDESCVKSDTCEIEIDNREGFSAPPINAKISIALGYEPLPVHMGEYIVDSWTKRGPPKVLTVSGKAAELAGKIKSHKIRSHHQTTVGAIVNKVAGDNGLTALVDSDLGNIPIDHIDQQNESDINFLTRLAKRSGAVFKLADGKVIFAAKGSKKFPSGKGKSAIVLTPSQVTSWQITSSERGGFKTASAHYMDRVAGRRKTATAGTPGGTHHREKRLYRTKEEAEAAAKANLGDLTRGKVSVSIEMPGDPLVFAECLVTLTGFDPDCDGTYLAKSVTHTFRKDGYTMSLSLENEA